MLYFFVDNLLLFLVLLVPAGNVLFSPEFFPFPGILKVLKPDLFLQELKEACKWFEKVLVQNIQSGMKQDLTESIRSVPRWRLIQASLPHVMHAVTNILFNRYDNFPSENH